MDKRFIENGNGTVTDIKTKVTYQWKQEYLRPFEFESDEQNSEIYDADQDEYVSRMKGLMDHRMSHSTTLKYQSNMTKSEKYLP